MLNIGGWMGRPEDVGCVIGSTGVRAEKVKDGRMGGRVDGRTGHSIYCKD